MGSHTLFLARRRIRFLARRLKDWLTRHPDRFLYRVSGVIHVGASSGQERHRYRRHGLAVAWIEPIPDVFEQLQHNIRDFPGQTAYRYLITDRDDETYSFFISNNAGMSSSILDLDLHREMWPGVHHERTIELESKTLPSMLRQEGIDAADYDSLVLDTQGSELMILEGAAELLDRFSFIKVEAADFEMYRGGCRLDELSSFLQERGFSEFARHTFAERPGVGSCYNMVYKRR